MKEIKKKAFKHCQKFESSWLRPQGLSRLEEAPMLKATATVLEDAA